MRFSLRLRFKIIQNVGTLAQMVTLCDKRTHAKVIWKALAAVHAFKHIIYLVIL